jgi:signal transduction histidine kinase
MIQPSKGGTAAEQRQARLLSVVLVVLSASAVPSMLLQLWLVPDPAPTFILVMAAVCSLAVAWVVNRRGHLQLGAAIASAALIVAAIAIAAMKPTESLRFGYVLVGILLGATFLSIRATAMLAAVAVVAVVILGLAVDRFQVSMLAANFVAICVATVVVTAHHRNALEADRLREQAEVQEQLMLKDRLSALGMLAANIGHEVNNPLTLVSANLQILERHMRAEDQEPLRSAQQGLDRIAGISRGLSTFARGDAGVATMVDVRRVLDAALSLADVQIRARARVVKSYEEVPAVLASPGRLEQVFLNLLINAAHAIPEGDPGAHEIRVCARTDPAGLVEIAVSDTGTGIPAEVRDRIFDPFFSTRPVGEGTGLGLAVSRSIVTAYGGQIALDQASTSGTTFRITLPRA